ncbi:hypothetical protein [Streptomyces sp. bgisy154]|uniref:hypothetical protein n=1 Tax=Streptomyces sp. bgisy154 TaxID=3413794 RepID=UPI003D73A257
MRTFWDESPSIIRQISLLLWALGLLTLFLGIYGDECGWWSDRSFLTNIASGVTAALFGIPVALLFLSQLATLQAEQAQRSAARGLAIRLAEEFRESVVKLVKEDAPENVDAHLSDVLIAFDSVRAQFRQAARACEDRPVGDRASQALRRAADALLQARGKWNVVFDSNSTKRARWTEIEHSWDIFTAESRTPLTEAGLPWLKPSLLHQTSETVKRPKNLRKVTYLATTLELSAGDLRRASSDPSGFSTNRLTDVASVLDTANEYVIKVKRLLANQELVLQDIAQIHR